MKRRGKHVTLVLCGTALALLAAAAFGSRDWMLGEWYLWKLRTGDTEEQVRAAERVAELGVVRAMPALFEKMRSDPSRAAEPFAQSLTTLARHNSGDVLAHLDKAIATERGPGRLHAIHLLQRMEAGREVAVESLALVVKSGTAPTTRLEAARTLAAIGRPAGRAAGAMISYVRESMATGRRMAPTRPVVEHRLQCGTFVRPDEMATTRTSRPSSEPHPHPEVLAFTADLCVAAPEAVFTAIADEEWKLKEALLDVLVERGETAPLLVALNSPRETIRRMAVWALGEFAERDDAVVRELAKRLDDSDSMVQGLAAAALEKLPAAGSEDFDE